MEDLDKRWIDAGDRRFALYSRVPPGKYVFKVIASNDEGLWSETASTVSIDIPPSFIQSIWFEILCGLVILLMLWLVYVLRFRQVNSQIRARLYERVAERERIARELHDTFLQSIQGLLLRFHTATSKLQPEHPAREMLDSVLKESDDVMAEGRDLLVDLHATTSKPNDLPDRTCRLWKADTRGLFR